MKRSYFVPLLVLAGFFLMYGASCITFGVLYEPRLRTVDKLFESAYEKGVNYSSLYEEALTLRRELSRRTIDYALFAGGCLATIGLIFFWWALDRRLLVLRLRQAAPQEEKSKA